MVLITGLIAIPLCFTCLSASVDDVKNNVSGSLTFTYYYKAEDISSLKSSLFYTSDFGSYHHFTPAYTSDMEQFPYKSYVSCSSSINVDSPVDIYIGVDSGYYEWDLSSSSIWAYHNSSGDFSTSNYPATGHGIAWTFSGGTLSFDITSSSTSSISSVNFFFFDDVPAGSYSFVCNLDELYALQGYGAGIYVFDPSLAPPQTVIDQFNSGDLTFSEAIDQIYNQYQSEVNSVTSVEEKIFVVEKYQYFTSQLEAQVNTMGVSSVRSFSDSSTQFSSSYRSGSISVTEALDGISSSYRNHLNGCNTVEEVTALNTEYQFVMSEMQNFADEKASSILSSANSSTKTVIDEYDSLESYFTDQLVVQDFQDVWNLVTPADFMDSLSSLTLRNIVEVFLSDTYISNYILLPLSLLPLTIILTTGIYSISKSRNHNSRGDD